MITRDLQEMCHHYPGSHSLLACISLKLIYIFSGLQLTPQAVMAAYPGHGLRQEASVWWYVESRRMDLNWLTHVPLCPHTDPGGWSGGDDAVMIAPGLGLEKASPVTGSLPCATIIWLAILLIVIISPKTESNYPIA